MFDHKNGRGFGRTRGFCYLEAKYTGETDQAPRQKLSFLPTVGVRDSSNGCWHQVDSGKATVNDFKVNTIATLAAERDDVWKLLGKDVKDKAVRSRHFLVACEVDTCGLEED